jgi:hypothetical protein
MNPHCHPGYSQSEEAERKLLRPQFKKVLEDAMTFMISLHGQKNESKI